MNVKTIIKYFIISAFALAIVFIAFPKIPAQASQGCCSWHGGESGSCSGGREVCNDGTLSPSCGCSGGTGGWGCTFGGQTYTNVFLATVAWNDGTRKIVDYAYPATLRRPATQADYSYWTDKRPFNNCKGEGLSSQTVIDDIKNGDEYKHLQWLDSHKGNIRQAFFSIMGRNATETEVNDWANKEGDINVIKDELKKTDEYQKRVNWLGFYLSRYKWWLLGILAYLIFAGVQYYNDNHKEKPHHDKSEPPKSN